MTETEIAVVLKKSKLLPYPQQLYGDKANIYAIAMELFAGSGEIAATLQRNHDNLPVINGDRAQLKEALGQTHIALSGLAIALGFTLAEIEQAGLDKLKSQ